MKEEQRSVPGDTQARLVENWGLLGSRERLAQKIPTITAGNQDSPPLREVTVISQAACLQKAKGQGSALAWHRRCSGLVRMFFRSLPALRLEGRQVEWGRSRLGHAPRAKVPGSEWTCGQAHQETDHSLWLPFVLYSFLLDTLQ